MRLQSSSMKGGRLTRAVALGALAALVIGALPTAAAIAAAPAAAVLVAPADGSTTPTTAPTLQVTASDPDGGGQLSVEFEGRVKGATVPVPGGADPFTIVAIPDTQNYTYLNRQGTILQQSQWVVNTEAQLGTAFAVHLGDLVSEYTNPTQWGHVSAGLAPLDAAVPNSIVPGNHDFDNASGAVGPYDTWFPPQRYANAAWNTATSRYGGYLGQNQFGPDPIDRRNMDNYALFTAGGRDFLVLNLEWEAPQYALDWAHRVLAAHPDRIVVMATHSFINVNGNRKSTAERPGGTSTAKLWTDFVSTHCQIRLVLSGHEHNGEAGEARRTDANTCGQPVLQVLTDYQDRANGGDGWLRTYRFDPAAGTVTAATYSPKLDRYETDADSAFTEPFPLAGTQPAPFASIGMTTVAAGSQASTTWPGLTADTAYEWRAVVNDGVSSTVSDTWTLRTPPPPPPAELARDAFTRTTTTGFGTATVGGNWIIGGTTADTSVDGNAAVFRSPTAGRGQHAYLSNVSSTDTDLRTSVRIDRTPGGTGLYLLIIGRQLTLNNDYRAKLRINADGSTALYLTRLVAGTETTLPWTTLPGTYQPGTSLNIRLQVTGTAPTTIRAKVWPTTQTEPTTWNIQTTDTTTALQGPGTIGLAHYTSSSTPTTSLPITISWNDITAMPTTVTPPPPPPVNTPPVAAFTSAPTGLDVRVDASTSSDAEGAIASYSWAWGDGAAPGNGAVANHTYAQGGTYPVTLTVTDGQGLTGRVTRNVTVAPPPPPPAELARDTFTRTTTTGFGTATVGGNWIIGGTTANTSVDGNAAVFRSPTAGRGQHAYLSNVSSTDTDLRTSVKIDRTPGGTGLYLLIIGRQLTLNNDYRAKLRINADGSTALYLTRLVAGTETTLPWTTLPGTYQPGTSLNIRLQVTGTAPTTIRAKVWPTTQTEPTTWNIQTTDTTTALQGPGTIGLAHYTSSSTPTTSLPITISWNDITAMRP
ncbi:PKD domain-containing protein [Agromyces salentinus]|uniref:PKD domain-containing protein n=1 Tax=Agromyces salentinus TaxID=269421 RepID=A0ABN2MJ18_9MICO|nr:PKD domain-containing protein [Agromyces salentinus]